MGGLPGSLFVICLLPGLPAGSSGAEDISIAINCGGLRYEDPCGQIWVEDTYNDGGRAASTAMKIAGTLDQPLFSAARIGESGEPLAYHVPVSAGDYQVILFFAEIEPGGAGTRRFDAEVEGIPVASDLDIESAVGPHALHAILSPVSVQDGAVDIILNPLAGDSLISAIEIRQEPLDCFRCPTLPVLEFDPEDSLAGMSWLNLAPYDEIRIFRDGELITDPPLQGEAQEFLDLEASIGLHTYRLEAGSGGNECSWDREVTLGCLMEIQCGVEPNGSVSISWLNGATYEGIDLLIDLDPVDSIAGFEVEYLTEPLAAGDHRITLIPFVGDASCPGGECLVKVSGAQFRRGDTDGSGTLDLTDVIRALNFQFVGELSLDCQDAADVDDDGEISLTDAIRSLGYQFVGTPGTIPEPPGPFACGTDPSPDDLPACDYPACP